MDMAWAKWKIEVLEKEEKTLHGWDSTPKIRRELWQSTVSTDKKKRAQGWNYITGYAMRFWRHGQRNPRRRKGGF